MKPPWPRRLNACEAGVGNEGRFRHQRRRQREFLTGKPFDCLMAWVQGKCKAVVSPALLAEYHETVEELRLDYPSRIPAEWADTLAESALLVFPTDRATGATPDPDDEMMLECAVAGDADYIVTGDKKHLLALREFQNIPIVSPAEFLRLLPGK